jgi:hypothetical protein
MSAHITPPPLADVSRETPEANPARAYRARGKRLKRRAARTRNALRSEPSTLAFRGTDDAHNLAPNPNRAKRHASRANLNLHDDPSEAARARVSGNEGRRRHGGTCRTPELKTTFARIPSLGPAYSRRAIPDGTINPRTEPDS